MHAHLLLATLTFGPLPALAEDHDVVIGDLLEHRFIPGFVCVNIDWWPATKCDFGHCPWAKSSVLTLDLKDRVVQNAMKLLGPRQKLRIGGSLSDLIRYDFSENGTSEKCHPFKKTEYARLGYDERGTCLQWQRWEELQKFCSDFSCDLIFGLNGLNGFHKEPCPKKTKCHVHGKRPDCCTKWKGRWDSQNSFEFLQRVRDAKHKIYALQMGNEIFGPNGIGAHLTVQQYGEAVNKLSEKVNELWEKHPPMIMGPDTGYDKKSLEQLINKTGQNISSLTIHKYVLGRGDKSTVKKKMLDPHSLDKLQYTAVDSVRLARKRKGLQLWMGEAGGAYDSGAWGASDSFMNSFWFNHDLGLLATAGYNGFCRQTLVGGVYGLLRLEGNTFMPNPDFYSSVLWRRLVGTQAFSVSIDGSNISHSLPPSQLKTRAYATCGKGGGVVLIGLNFNSHNMSRIKLAVGPGGLGEEKIEYVLHAPKVSSTRLWVNGQELKVGESGEIPDVLQLGNKTRAEDPLTLPPHSIIFAHYPSARLEECPRQMDSDDEGIDWAAAVEIVGVTVISFAVASTIFAACHHQCRQARRYKHHTRVSTEEEKLDDEEVELSESTRKMENNELDDDELDEVLFVQHTENVVGDNAPIAE